MIQRYLVPTAAAVGLAASAVSWALLSVIFASNDLAQAGVKVGVDGVWAFCGAVLSLMADAVWALLQSL